MPTKEVTILFSSLSSLRAPKGTHLNYKFQTLYINFYPKISGKHTEASEPASLQI